MGRRRRYQQSSAQLQRRAADLRGVSEQLRVQAEENLGEGSQNGRIIQFFNNEKSVSLFFFYAILIQLLISRQSKR